MHSCPHVADAFSLQVEQQGIAERRNADSRHQLLHRIAAEYRVMAGLSLTVPQACRLFHLTPEVCERIVRELMQDGVLELSPEGHLVRGPLMAR